MAVWQESLTHLLQTWEHRDFWGCEYTPTICMSLHEAAVSCMGCIELRKLCCTELRELCVMLSARIDR